MKFSWSPEKARRNRAKHGISFDAAKRVFDDPHLIVSEDCVDEEGEMRFHGLGSAGTQSLLLVVFVMRQERDQEIIHIISARKAVEYEISAYTDQF